MLGADYLGFHTNDYAHHFRTSCLRVLGTSSSPDAILHEGRCIGIGVDPIGIDVERFIETLSSPAIVDLIVELEQRYGDRKLILGVERLDYTKGVPLKFRAFERFLQREPSRANDVTMLQIMVPSRLEIPDYRELKSEIEEHVGRLNGTFGGPGVTPVEYMYRSLTPEQLVSLYRFADVGLVAPLRDGMNLVAQEFTLCQGTQVPGLPDANGILVLSEFAGSAHSLSRAILVNPWNIDLTADALEDALAMDNREKRDRMRPMAALVREMDCNRWAKRFMEKLTAAAQRSRAAAHSTLLSGKDAEAVVQRFLVAPRRHLFLDYDGTLREFTKIPEHASPSGEILELLRGLAALPETVLHLVSGRLEEDLDAWFGDLPIHLCAEHGYSTREPGGHWCHMRKLDLSWMRGVRKMLEDVTHEVPGTRLETKRCALAWHYRMSELDYGVWRARELLSTLEEDLANQPVEVIAGQQVIEVRAAGVNKGRYVLDVVSEAGPHDFILCIGDDRTDLDMYRVLPEGAVSVHVDGGAEEAQYTLASPARVRAFLHRLVESGSRQFEEAGR
jgi:trehalose 6-phosphate synthase/phosphatase